MIVWLGSGSNVKEHPNENFARELGSCSPGIGLHRQDVVEAARVPAGIAKHQIHVQRRGA